MSLPPFPLDDVTLVLILDALDTSLTYEGENGEWLEEPRRVGGAFGLHQLLDFYAGYDESKLIPEDDNDVRSIPMFTYPDQLYCEADLIRELVHEVRRLRQQVPGYWEGYDPDQRGESEKPRDTGDDPV